MLQRWEILDLKKFFYISFADAEFDLIALLLDGCDICDKAQTKLLHSNSSLFLIGWSCFP